MTSSDALVERMPGRNWQDAFQMRWEWERRRLSYHGIYSGGPDMDEFDIEHALPARTMSTPEQIRQSVLLLSATIGIILLAIEFSVS